VCPHYYRPPHERERPQLHTLSHPKSDKCTGHVGLCSSRGFFQWSKSHLNPSRLVSPLEVALVANVRPKVNLGLASKPTPTVHPTSCFLLSGVRDRAFETSQRPDSKRCDGCFSQQAHRGGGGHRAKSCPHRASTPACFLLLCNVSKTEF
jgi:hypothetical protein